MIARTYELKKHLVYPVFLGGNVLATVSDRKDYNGTNFTADISSSQDYYPFGMHMPGRTFSSNNYKYGFNGMEKDDELKGAGNSYDFGARIYDSRLGRWLSVDPKFKKGPQYSPYIYSFNSPILFYEPDGLWPLYSHYKMTNTVLLEAGYSKEIAAEIAHYSAVYADNPNPEGTSLGTAVLLFNVAVGISQGIPPSDLLYKDNDYSNTNYSQSDEDIRGASIHATRTWWEDTKPEDAINRALYGGVFKDLEGNEVVIEGAYNVIERLKDVDEKDLTKQNKMDLGQALHTIQDVDAHRGDRFIDKHSEQAEKNGYTNEHSVKRDLFGSLEKSMNATRDAVKKLSQKK